MGGIAQAATGFLGTSFYMRIIYPLLALLVAIPVGLFSYALFSQSEDDSGVNVDDTKTDSE